MAIAEKLSQKNPLGILSTGDEFYVISSGSSYRIEASVARQYMLDGIDPLLIKGNWNASTNTPTLTDGVGNVGDFYIIDVAGTQNLGSGNISFEVGDWVIYTADLVWIKSLNSLPVLTATQVGFGDVANKLTSSASLTWDDIGKALTVFGKASIFGALAAGNANTASGTNSQAFGTGNTSNANNSTAFGDSNTASGANSLATGTNNGASGAQSAIFGKNGSVTADNAVAVGEGLVNQAYNSSAVGKYNVIEGSPTTSVDTDPAFVVGNGTSGIARVNTLKILKNGSTVIGDNNVDPSLFFDVVSTTKASRPNPPMTTAQKNAIPSPKIGFKVYDTDLNKDSTYNGTSWDNGEVVLSATQIGFGDGSNELTSNADLTWNNSTKKLKVNGLLEAGSNNTASGTSSQAFGNNNTATNLFSHAVGSDNTSSGQSSLATGSNNTASGAQSAVFGQGCVTTADNAVASGEGVENQSYASIALGSFNIVEGNPTTWSNSDPALVIGDGTSDVARSNSFRLQKSGQMVIGSNTIAFQVIFRVVSTTKASSPYPPMTTAQKNAIGFPVAGYGVYDTDLNAPSIYDGTSWRQLAYV